MIVQGMNSPVVITFDEDVSGFDELVVSLWDPKRPERAVKVWQMEEMTIDADTVSCPVTQEMSAAWPSGQLVLEAKGVTGGTTVLWDRVPISCGHRYDAGL